MENQAERVAGFDKPGDTESTSRRVAKAAHEAIDEGADRAEKLERQLRSKAGEAGERVEASQAAAAAKIEDSMDRLEAFVKERPIAATGIAFAAGVLATVLLRR